MSKRLLNSEVIYTLSKMGHYDTICIADSGLPIPGNVKRIDLAITKDYPSFEKVLEAIVESLCVQKAYVASEIKICNEKVNNQISNLIAVQDITFIDHTALKEMTKNCVAVIRTGECSAYANIILELGVNF